MIRVAILDTAIDLASEIAGVEDAAMGTGRAGAVASFAGYVRADDGVTALTLEHYPAMTQGALTELAERAAERWALLAVTIVHRVGRMVPGDRIVLVVTAAPHRAAALEGCAALIDRLKTRAPFWKLEERGDERRWVEPHADDAGSAGRWD